MWTSQRVLRSSSGSQHRTGSLTLMQTLWLEVYPHFRTSLSQMLAGSATLSVLFCWLGNFCHRVFHHYSERAAGCELLSWGFPNEIPWLSQQKVIVLKFWRLGIPNLVASRSGPLGGCENPVQSSVIAVFPVCPPLSLCAVCACVFISYFYKDTSGIGLGPT